MTVSTTTSRVDYIGNGVTVSFPIPFPFIDENGLRFVRTVIATGVETTLTLTTDYSVTVSADGSVGTGTVVTAPTAAQQLSIIRDIAATQEADFVANDPLPAETFEDSLDKLTMLIQDTAAGNISRVPRLYDSDTDGSGRYNSNGNRYANAADGIDPTDLATLQQVIGAGSGDFIQSGIGAVTRTMQNKARDVVSAKDFGAVGDGAIVAGAVTGTNDTAALNLAIAACGNNKVLYVPAGMYLVTPGGLDLIQCSVDAPDAVFIGTTSSGTDHIFNLDYQESYPVTLGAGVTGLDTWKTFRVHQIIGSPGGDVDKSNTAIHLRRCNQAQIYVDVVRGCAIGVHFDGPSASSHVGTNDVNIGHVYQCDIGFKLESADAPNGMCEANRITCRYMYGFTTAAFELTGVLSGGLYECCDNVIDVVSIGMGFADAHVFKLNDYASRNHFYLRSWDSGVSGTGRYVVLSAGSDDNYFHVPSYTRAQLTWNGDRNRMEAWRGDFVPILRARLSAPQNISLATDTVILFDVAEYDTTAAYNPVSGAYQPTQMGYYRVSATAAMNGTTPTLVAMALTKNGVADTQLASIDVSTSGRVIGGSAIVYLNGTTDYIQITGYIIAASGAQIGGGIFSTELIQST